MENYQLMAMTKKAIEREYNKIKDSESISYVLKRLKVLKTAIDSCIYLMEKK